MAKISSLQSMLDNIKNDKVDSNEFFETQMQEKQMKIDELSKNMMDANNALHEKEQTLLDCTQKLQILQGIHAELTQKHEQTLVALSEEETAHKALNEHVSQVTNAQNALNELSKEKDEQIVQQKNAILALNELSKEKDEQI